MFLAVSFALAGYDALYEAFVKITKKQIFSEELLISLAFLVSIVLGYATFAVIGLLLYSTVSFARKIIRHPELTHYRGREAGGRCECAGGSNRGSR